MVEVAVGEVAVEEAEEAGGQVEGEGTNTVRIEVEREGQVKVIDDKQGAEDKQGEESDLFRKNNPNKDL